MTDLFATPARGQPLPDFPCFVEVKAMPTIAPAQVPLQLQLEEVRREHDHRIAAYPRMIDNQRISAEEGDREIAIMAAIGEDLAALHAVMGLGGHSKPLLLADDGFAWADKVRSLQREIGMRRRLYPKWMGDGRLDGAAAERQLSALESAHWTYWHDGFRWTAANGHACHWGALAKDLPADRAAGILAARDEFRAHTARFAPQQQEIAA